MLNLQDRQVFAFHDNTLKLIENEWRKYASVS